MFKHHLPRVVNPSEGGLELLSDLDYDMLALVSMFYIYCEIKVFLLSASNRKNQKNKKKLHDNCFKVK